MNLSREVVYVVDDDASFRQSVMRLARVNGFEAEGYASAEAFLSKADIRAPGCLLLDVRLPDIDGLHLQQNLKAKGSVIPIVFMTGHGSIPMGVKAVKAA